MSKRVVILGSSGSIGKNAFEVCRHLGYEVVGLAVHSNVQCLWDQWKVSPHARLCIYSEDKSAELPQARTGDDGLLSLLDQEVDLVVAAMTGTAGIQVVFDAISKGVDVAIANKEVLVSAGPLVMKKAKETGAKVIPIDSEHSALMQCMHGPGISKLVLTASGGPFRERENLEDITLDQALKHPTWNMGVKNTIDSSTLINKGLEVIEACHLFDMKGEDVEVLVHPQSIIHAIVHYCDGSSLTHISQNDMRVPIQYALTYPEREEGLFPNFDLASIGTLTFEKPNFTKFPGLRLAYDALEAGGSMTACYTAANEVLVSAFVEGEIAWHEIAILLESAMNAHQVEAIESVSDVLRIDNEVKRMTQGMICKSLSS